MSNDPTHFCLEGGGNRSLGTMHRIELQHGRSRAGHVQCDRLNPVGQAAFVAVTNFRQKFPGLLVVHFVPSLQAAAGRGPGRISTRRILSVTGRQRQVLQ